MKQGSVKFFNSTKGFGFIKDDESGIEYFVHISGINENTLNENDVVKFDVVEGKKGPNAVNVTLV